MRRLLNYLLLAAFAACPISVSAQSMVAKSIVFNGAPQSQAELLTLSGLTPGQTLTKADIEAAAHKLDSSGLFTNIQYSTASGVLTFELEAAVKAPPQQVRYTNFVWFTQAELNDAVQAKMPTFTGTVPADGPQKDQVAGVLVTILKERGVTATVDSEAAKGNKLEYRITSPPVVMSDLQIENIRWESDPVLESVRKAQAGADYIEGISQTGVNLNLAYALKELGFLDATVGAIGHSAPKVEANRIGVVMTGSATPGGRYKIAHVTLPEPIGTVTAGDLKSEHQVQPGGIPSPSLVENTTARLNFVFQGHGFLDAKASVASSTDATAHTASYVFSVAPGEVYHFRNLLFAADISDDQKSQITKAWKLPQGAVYEGVPVGATLRDLKTLCTNRPPTVKPIPDAATHQVDASLSCKPQR